jgi:anti-sigma regulatory factor (Ser/Thr protein kinase)
VNEAQTSARQSASGLFHAALLYQNDDHLGAVVAEFGGRAADAGEPVLAVLPRGSYELVQNALQATGAETHFEDMSERGGNPSCLLDLVGDWIDDHDGPVRVIDEPLWPGRTQPEIAEVLRHEALINHVLAPFSASILSPYDRVNLDADALEGAALTHPQLITNGVPRPSELYGDPLDVYAGTRWPQPSGNEPISEFKFEGDLRALRAAVAADPVTHLLSRSRRADLVFVVHEAATNAVKHGGGRAVARLWRDGETVICEVSTPSPLKDAAVGRRRPSLDAAGGRGLWLINQICNLAELRSAEDGTTLRMHLRDS